MGVRLRRQKLDEQARLLTEKAEAEKQQLKEEAEKKLTATGMKKLDRDKKTDRYQKER